MAEPLASESPADASATAPGSGAETPSTTNERPAGSIHESLETNESNRLATALEKQVVWLTVPHEFLQKYGNDLDTSLIFAGLFSAISSAFIIQIQPELQADPDATTQALLLLLVQNMTGTASSAIQTVQQSAGPATIIHDRAVFCISATSLSSSPLS
ncbi:hypothetical protein C8R44DRAFT_877716 [Mycena epipterygia]|nr:hypothetical protein C8R44DRAFT_877716 [Mycena epipterygia]